SLKIGWSFSLENLRGATVLHSIDVVRHLSYLILLMICAQWLPALVQNAIQFIPVLIETVHRIFVIITFNFFQRIKTIRGLKFRTSRKGSDHVCRTTNGISINHGVVLQQALI